MFEFCLPFCVRGECVARMQLALGLDREHFPGVIKYGSGRFYFGASPSSVAERAEWRRFFPCANIAGNEIRLLEWNIELRFICKLKGKNFLLLLLEGMDRRAVLSNALRRARRSRPTNFHESKKSPDTVFEVHDEVALVKLTEINLRAIAVRTTQTPARMGRESP